MMYRVVEIIMAVVGVVLLVLKRCPICATKLDNWHLLLYYCPRGCHMEAFNRVS